MDKPAVRSPARKKNRQGRVATGGGPLSRMIGLCLWSGGQ